MSGPFAFDASTPAEAQTKPWRRLGDHERRAGSDDLARLAENHLDAPRIGVTGELACAIGRLDPGELDDATLDLRDGLLSDDEHVVVLEAAGPRGGIDEERAEIVSLLELRDSRGAG